MAVPTGLLRASPYTWEQLVGIRMAKDDFRVRHYPHYLDDYERSTAQFTLLQHGAYRRLLDAYYKTEGNVSAEPSALYRLLGAITDDEQAAVRHVLELKFEQVDGKLRHARGDEELAKIRELVGKRREAGSAGGKARVANQAKANGKQVLEHLPKQTSTKVEVEVDVDVEHKEEVVVTPGEAPDLPPPAPCPFQQIVDAYHEVLPNHRRVHCLTHERKELLSAAWRWTWQDRQRRGKQADHESVLNSMRGLFGLVAESKLLTGRVPGKDGRKPFVAGLDWILKPSNILDIIENKWDE